MKRSSAARVEDVISQSFSLSLCVFFRCVWPMFLAFEAWGRASQPPSSILGPHGMPGHPACAAAAAAVHAGTAARRSGRQERAGAAAWVALSQDRAPAHPALRYLVLVFRPLLKGRSRSFTRFCLRPVKTLWTMTGNVWQSSKMLIKSFNKFKKLLGYLVEKQSRMIYKVLFYKVLFYDL